MALRRNSSFFFDLFTVTNVLDVTFEGLSMYCFQTYLLSGFFFSYKMFSSKRTVYLDWVKKKLYLI